MAISFVRVDDRIIHGQIITQWMRKFPCDGIIIVNDELANNTVLSQIYKSAVPSGIKVFIFTVEKAVSKVPEAKKSLKNYFLIAKSPEALSKLTEQSVDFGKYIVYGPSSYREGTTTIGPNQSLTKEEMDSCEILNNHEIQVEFKLTPDKKGFIWGEIREKYYK